MHDLKKKVCHGNLLHSYHAIEALLALSYSKGKCLSQYYFSKNVTGMDFRYGDKVFFLFRSVSWIFYVKHCYFELFRFISQCFL